MENELVLRPDYDPFLQQVAFHEDRYTVKHRLVSAATGGGKTKCGFAEVLYWTLECPGSTGLIMYPTFRMLRNILLAQTIPETLGMELANYPLVQDFNKMEFMVNWKAVEGEDIGTKWILLGLDEPEIAEGMSVDWAWVDEFRLIGGSGPSAVMKQQTVKETIIRRLRGSVYGRKRNYPVGFWVTTTPDEPGSPLHKAFEDPKTKFENCKVYRWGIDANIKLSEDWRKEVKASHVPGTGLYNRFVLGLFAMVGIGSYAFDGSIHIFDQYPPRTQIVDVQYGVDWGWTNPSVVLAIGFDYDGRALILEEFYQARTSIETLIRAAKEMRDRWEPATQGNPKGIFWCDASEPGNINEFRKAGLNAIANETKRDDGIREMGGRFPKSGDGKPRLYVHRGCVNWISEVQVYDSNLKQGDHAMDGTRYVLANKRKTGQPAWFFG